MDKRIEKMNKDLDIIIKGDSRHHLDHVIKRLEAEGYNPNADDADDQLINHPATSRLSRENRRNILRHYGFHGLADMDEEQEGHDRLKMKADPDASRKSEAKMRLVLGKCPDEDCGGSLGRRNVCSRCKKTYAQLYDEHAKMVRSKRAVNKTKKYNPQKQPFEGTEPTGTAGNWTTPCGAHFRYHADALSHMGILTEGSNPRGGCPGNENCPTGGVGHN